MQPPFLPSGQPITIDSGKPGPSVAILGGVHGDERGGIEVIDRIRSDPSILRLTKGRVIIAYGNTSAIKRNVRYTDANLNRMFADSEDPNVHASYEWKRAQELKTILKQADILIDLHASFTAGSKPFAICERNAFQIVRMLPVQKVCSGFDTMQPGGTDFYMNSIGKIGICIECGYLDEAGSADFGFRSCLASLSALGMTAVTVASQPVKQAGFDAFHMYITKTDRFTLTKKFEDFAVVAKGDLIGRDGDKNIYAPEKCYILFARDRSKKNAEAFVLLREAKIH